MGWRAPLVLCAIQEEAQGWMKGARIANEPGADSKNTKLPYWSNQLTPNRLEWARDKLAEGLEQGEDRSEVEQRLMFQLLEMGWIE